MTSEGLTAAGPLEGDERQFCYRHPQRETYVRCGRCDRPICTGCAMQGPVGLRCRQCGQPAHDPLTSLTPRQAAGAAVVALGAGTVTGLASSVGLLGLFVGLLAGRFAADRGRRASGYKEGRKLLAVIFVAIVAGTYLGYSLIWGTPLWPIYAYFAATTVDDLGISLQVGGWAVLAAAVACLGAYWRLR